MTTLVKLNNGTAALNPFFDDFFRRDNSVSGYWNKILSNIKETKDSYVLELMAPGFKKENISITLDENKLRIIGKSENEKQAESSDLFHIKEFSITSFEKNFKLPKEADPELIKAKFEDGVIQLVIPKKSKEETKLQKTITLD